MTASILQSIHKQYTSTASTTQAFGTLTNGTTLIACLTIESVSITATCSDSANGSYTADAYSDTGPPANPTTKGRAYIFRVANTSTGTPTVTITLSGSTYGQLELYEVSGLATSPVDATIATSYSSGRAATALSITTTAANDAVFVFYSGDSSTFTADSGYTQAYAAAGQFSAYGWGEAIADAGAAGAKTIAFVSNFNAQDFGIVAVAYKLPSAATVDPGIITGSATVIGSPFLLLS